MFRRFSLLTPLHYALPVVLLAAPGVLQAQRECLGCAIQQRGEPTPEDWLGAPAEAPQAKGGNGRGNNGNGNGNGGSNNGGGGGSGGGGADDGDGGPEEAGCGNGVGGGSGNGTQGNGDGQACGDGSGNNGGGNGNGNNGNGNGNGGSNQGPPELTIQNEINFGRLILLGSGESSVLLDLESGQKITAGNLDDYGGVTMVGRATVTGNPNSEVQVTLPTRVTMRDPRGGIAELREFTTSLPLVPRLDNNGVLEFTFTGRLAVTDTIGDGGDLRGRVPITVEYN